MQGWTSAAFYFAKNEATAKAKGIECVTGPSLGSTIPEMAYALLKPLRMATSLFDSIGWTSAREVKVMAADTAFRMPALESFPADQDGRFAPLADKAR